MAKVSKKNKKKVKNKDSCSASSTVVKLQNDYESAIKKKYTGDGHMEVEKRNNYLLRKKAVANKEMKRKKDRLRYLKRKKSILSSKEKNEFVQLVKYIFKQ